MLVLYALFYILKNEKWSMRNHDRRKQHLIKIYNPAIKYIKIVYWTMKKAMFELKIIFASL